MIYLFENQDNFASIVFNGDSISEHEKTLAVVVDKLPDRDDSLGTPHLKCKKETGDVWWEYTARDKTQQELIDEIEQLKVIVAGLVSQK